MPFARNVFGGGSLAGSGVQAHVFRPHLPIKGGSPALHAALAPAGPLVSRVCAKGFACDLLRCDRTLAAIAAADPSRATFVTALATAGIDVAAARRSDADFAAHEEDLDTSVQELLPDAGESIDHVISGRTGDTPSLAEMLLALGSLFARLDGHIMAHGLHYADIHEGNICVSRLGKGWVARFVDMESVVDVGTFVQLSHAREGSAADVPTTSEKKVAAVASALAQFSKMVARIVRRTHPRHADALTAAFTPASAGDGEPALGAARNAELLAAFARGMDAALAMASSARASEEYALGSVVAGAGGGAAAVASAPMDRGKVRRVGDKSGRRKDDDSSASSVKRPRRENAAMERGELTGGRRASSRSRTRARTPSRRRKRSRSRG